MNSSRDYRDYVIKDGQFVGAFEQMYQDCEDPWQQLQIESFAHELILAEMQKRRAEGAGWCHILDLGCGLGRLTAGLSEAAGCRVIGADVSVTATKRAGALHGGRAAFVAGNAAALPFRERSFDCVFMADILWYVLPEIVRTLKGVASALRTTGELWVLQSFYPAGVQQYGNHVMSEPRDCLVLLAQAGFHVSRTLELDRYANHKLILFAQKAATS